MTNDSFRLIACPTLSHERRTDTYCETGKTLRAHLEEIGWSGTISARVFIDGQLIPNAEWETMVPRAGQSIVIRRVLQMGGGGGRGGKQIGMIIGMIALMVASWWIGGGGLAALLPEGLQMVGTVGGWQAAGAAVLVGGSLALNALIQPSRPRLGSLSNLGDGSAALSLTGSSNEMKPYARIPRVYGTHLVYPPLAARPFTEVVGNSQYLRLLYCFGYGPLSISLDTIKIGETPLSQFSNYEMEVRSGYQDDAPLTLIPSDVFEDALSLLVRQSAGPIIRTSQSNAKELSIDISCPDGMQFIDGSGRPGTHSVGFDLDYRKVGDVSWIAVGGAAAVTAKIDTNFTGANNDLTITRTISGVSGNNRNVIFQGGSTAKVEWEYVSGPTQNPTLTKSGNVLVTIVQGVTTANAVISLWNAHAEIPSQLATIAAKAGNTGAGAITLPTVLVYGRDGLGTPYPYQSLSFSGGANAIPSFSVSGNTRALVRKNVRWTVAEPGAQYEVRLTRTGSDNPPTSDSQIIAATYWTMLRTIQASGPVTKKGLAFLALRIKATDQLNGTVDTLNAVVTSVLQDWDAATNAWTLRATNNPASVYRDVLQGSANRRPKSDSQLDLPTIQAFHARNIINGYTFNAVIDFQTTVKQLRQDVLAAARATFGLKDMKYSVVEDLAQPTPADIITARTTSGFKWTRRFLKMPHAFKVRFVDADNNYKQGEVFVYADGYNANNSTDFEETDAGIGVVNATQVWKLKRKELADALLRADDYEVTMDFANLNVTRGDRVQLQHDVILAGLATGRIKSRTLNGSSQCTAITFDEPFTMVDGTNYGARIRKADGTQVLAAIVTSPGEVLAVTFTTPIAASTTPAVGDLVSFGVLGLETIDCIVKSIDPGPDYTAMVKLQDYAPGIQTADTTTIPPYDAQISLPALPTPPIPIIIQTKSDESVLVRDIDGALSSRIVVSVHFSSGLRLIDAHLETQFRVTNSDDDWATIITAISGTSVESFIAPVQEGFYYDVRLRAVDRQTGLPSAWAYIDAHLVVGKTTMPPDVTTVVLEGDRLRWVYDDPPPDLDGFLVRFRPGTSRLWDSATPAHLHVIKTTDFQIFRQGGTWTFLVKAVDVAGNESANAYGATINLGEVLVDNILITQDHRALGWPGTITNATIFGGDLVANTSVPFWTTDSTPMWPLTDASLFWNDPVLEMIYQFSFAPSIDDLDASVKIELAASGDWRLEYQLDSTEIMWDPDSGIAMWGASGTIMWAARGEWIAWPGVLSSLLYHQYMIRFVAAAGTVPGSIQQFTLIIDIRDIFEDVQDFTIGVGGSRLPLFETYRDIVRVHLDLQADGGTAAYLKLVDKHPSLGPLVIAYDSSNAETTATIDATIQGY